MLELRIVVVVFMHTPLRTPMTHFLTRDVMEAI